MDCGTETWLTLAILCCLGRRYVFSHFSNRSFSERAVGWAISATARCC